MDMDSVRITSGLPRVSHKIALMGSLVSRLVAFCLLYFAPTLAYEQGSPEPAPQAVAQVPAATESLDPKHGKDHDEGREAERGRSHDQHN